MITLQQTKNIAIAAVAGLILPAAQAQFISKDYKRSADQFYAKGDYYSAAQYYEKYLGGKAGGVTADYNPYQVKRNVTGKDKGNNKGEVVYKIAESYFNLRDYQHAEIWYKALLEDGAGNYPDARYKYGVSLRANGKYPEARQELEKFINDDKQGGETLAAARLELDNCKFIQKAVDAGTNKVTVNKLNGNVNKEGASYAAAWLNDNTLVFTSTRSLDSAKAQPVHTNTLYNATALTGGFTEPQKLGIPDVNDMQQGVASFTRAGNMVFFTRWLVDKEGKKISSIYKSEKSATEWSQPVMLEPVINMEGSSSRQPFVTEDGKYLLFSSDRAGGEGGFDIWYAPLTDGTPGQAVNAGASINTKEDEEAPFYHAASHQLVFSSNGRTGMGGFDLYTASGDLGASFSAPQNMGYPVNSVKDDMYFTSRGASLMDSALLSSDRASLCCLELFEVNRVKEAVVKIEKPVTPVVVEKVEEAIKTDGKFVSHFINFEFGKKDLVPGSDQYLDDIIVYLTAHPESKLEIAAYTDGIGSNEVNLRLSQQRAAVCVDYLTSKGIAAGRLAPKGYGECCPLETETTADGKDIPEAREKNRRVEFKLLP